MNKRNSSESSGGVSVHKDRNVFQNGYEAIEDIECGLCTLCKKRSICVCKRCGDYYCSPECQRKDWHSHRYICFKMPDLVTISSIDKDVKAIPRLTVPEENGQKQSFAYNGTTKDNSMNNISSSTHFSNNNSSTNFNSNKQNNSKVNPTLAIPISPLPKESSCVLLTGFRSPNRCYVRSLTDDEDTGYMMVMRTIDTFGKKAPPLRKLPKPHSYAITKKGGVMLRVQILSVRNVSSIRVLFVDIGSTSVRELSQLREINEEMIRLQQHAVLVQLRHVGNYNISDKLTNFMAQFEERQYKIHYGSADERSGNVELYDWESGSSLNEEMVNFASNMEVYVEGGGRARDKSDVEINKGDNKDTNAQDNGARVSRNTDEQNGNKNTYVNRSPQQPEKQHKQETQERCMEEPFKSVTLQEGAKDIAAIVLDNSLIELGYMSCIAKSDIRKLGEVQKYLHNLNLNDAASYEPILNEYCVAKFENEWYRAKVIEIPEEKLFTVVYCDFGNTDTLKSADIRPYPKDLKNECRLNLCLIDGLPSTLTPKQIKFLNKSIQFQSDIIIERIKGVLVKDQQIILVELSSILQKMQDDDLL